jgi:PAS domain S-box-containing protein
MQRSESNTALSPRTLERAGELFASHQRTIYRTTDRLFAVLMALQWLAGIAAALWISPRTWIGTVSETHFHVWAAIFLGAAINVLPISLAITRPGARITRYTIAIGQMLMSALLIHLTGGRIETHFHVFGSLAFLAFYRDWRILVPATIVVAADHFVRGLFWPESVYGILAASQWRWLEHAGWVLFEDAVLFVAIKNQLAEMWDSARHTAELNDNEERYRAVVEQTSEGLMLSDVGTLRVIECNAAFAKMLGYTVTQALSLTAYDFVVDDRETIAARVAVYRREGIGTTGERLFRRKDGSVLHVEINMTVIKYGGKDVFCTIVRDIGDRKRAEEALREAHDDLETKVKERTAELAQLNAALEADNLERRLAEQALKESQQWLTAIYESSRDGIIVEENEHTLFVNQSYAHLFGYEPGELIGQPVWLVSEQEPSKRMLEYSRKRMRGEEAPSLYEFRGTRKDGSIVDLEASVSTAKIDDRTLIVSLCRDITERKQAEDALHETNLALSNAMPGISILNSEGCYERVNEAYAEMVGYQPSEMVGMDWTPTVAPDDRNVTTAAYERMLSQGTAEFEARAVRKDGSTFYKQVLMVKRTDANGDQLGHYCFMRDISERKRMEEERQVISEIIQGVIATSDLNELLTLIHASISKCIYAENCFVALYDEATDSMHFEFWADKFDPRPTPRPVGVGFSSYVLRTGQPLLLDRKLTDEMVRSGKVEQSGAMSASWLGVPLKTSSRTVGVVVVQHYEDEGAYTQRDVDFLSSVGGQIALAIERKRGEEARKNQRAFLRQVIDLNPSFIFAKDMEGRFTLVNQALADAYGTTVQELIGKTDADFNSNKEEVERFRQDDLEVMDRNTEKFIPEEFITDASGNVRWLQTIKRPIISPDGTVMQMLGVATDITQRKKAEEALHESEEMLRQAQKMESIGTLAGGIAHDFNNLMTAVNGYSELVLRKMSEGDPLRSKVEEIKKAGERAASLTRQLLAFSRKQMLTSVVLDLNSVITGVGKMLPRLIGEDIDLRFELQVDLGQVKADPGQMEQVLMNLVVNARDAMPAGGRLTVKTENVEFAGRSVKRRVVVEPGSYVVLSVTDDGVGMDTETQSHIFEPFFTTKEVGKGTGLGLSTVYGIIKQTGGSIWVYSEPGKGTTFKIYLPLVDDVSAAAEESKQAQTAPTGHETVLLVEDEDMVRELAQEILEQYGYTVLTAANGTEGLRVCKEFQDKIDLVLTDVVMPQMSGPELAENILAIQPETRVLYMSGFTDDDVVRHGVLTEDMCFIQKPFSPEALAIKVREVLNNFRGHNGSHGDAAQGPDAGFNRIPKNHGYHPVN